MINKTASSQFFSFTNLHINHTIYYKHIISDYAREKYKKSPDHGSVAAEHRMFSRDSVYYRRFTPSAVVLYESIPEKRPLIWK